MASPKGEPDSRPARFYKVASAVEIEGGWTVALDARRLRTPAGRPLRLPNVALAQLLAEEWEKQGERIDVVRMSATRLANAALDRTPTLREVMAEEAARFAATDLVCYLADHPDALCDEQEACWAPLRTWCADTLDVRLSPVRGIMPVEQPQASLEAVRRHFGALSDLEATGLLHGISLFGSAVLGLALEMGRLTPQEAHDASRIDESYQARMWGVDTEERARAEAHLTEAVLLGRWFSALRDGDRTEPSS